MIGVVDYDAGNIRSVANALKTIGVEFLISRDIPTLSGCNGIILPGVGAAPGAMRSLEGSGLVPFLKSYRKPFLGICLGMQILFTSSEEGETPCLGILPGTVKKFDARAEKVPHMGWNLVEPTGPQPLLAGLPDRLYCYFAHSYYAPVGDTARAVTTCGVPFASLVESANYYGVQFHPEKSGPDGLAILHNFDDLCKSFRP